MSRGWANYFSHWYVKKIEKNILQHKTITNKDALRCIWTPLVKYSDYLSGGTFLNGSNTGTGKTELNQKLIEYFTAQDLTVVYISHRCSIAGGSLEGVKGVTHYQHIISGTEGQFNALILW